MKVFLDFGGNEGQGLKDLARQYGIDNSWVIETFEPNLDCNIESHVSQFDNIIVNHAAVWTHNGVVNFSKMLENTEGSSVECLMNKGACQDPNSPGYRHHNAIVEVPCVDISDILNKYRNAEFLLFKMDIEGSEFAVLRKAISDGSISCVNDLYVEWHQQYVEGEDDGTANDLRSQLSGLGIKLGEWR